MSFARSFKRLLAVVFIEDIPLKIVCLILAVLFWFYIDGELTDEREMVRPITVADLPLPKDKSMEVLSEAALPEVTLRVRGPRRRLQYVTPRDVQLDLREALKIRRGLQTVTLGRQLFSLEGVDILSVTPAEFNLVLTQTTEYLLTVQPATDGEVPRGYTLTKWEVEPQQVRVKSKEELESVRTILTEPIPVKDRTSGFRTVVSLARTVQVGEREVPVECDERVTVTLTIDPAPTHRELEDVPVRTLTPPGTSMTLDPPTVSVKVYGPENDVAPLRNTDVQVYVEWPSDWSLQGPSGKTFPARTVQVKVMAPPRVKVSGREDSALPTVKVQGKLTAGW